MHPSEEKLLYTRAEAAQQLSMSQRSIDYAVKQGWLVPTRFGRSVRFTAAAMLEFINRHTAPLPSGQSAA